MVLSIEGSCESRTEGGPIVFTCVLSSEGSCENRTEGGPTVFAFVLSPEGRCEAYPVGVQLFLLMFYFGLGNEL